MDRARAGDRGLARRAGPAQGSVHRLARRARRRRRPPLTRPEADKSRSGEGGARDSARSAEPPPADSAGRSHAAGWPRRGRREGAVRARRRSRTTMNGRERAAGRADPAGAAQDRARRPTRRRAGSTERTRLRRCSPRPAPATAPRARYTLSAEDRLASPRAASIAGGERIDRQAAFGGDASEPAARRRPRAKRWCDGRR